MEGFGGTLANVLESRDPLNAMSPHQVATQALENHCVRRSEFYNHHGTD